MVSNTAFEQAVLDALASLKTEVASLKTEVASLKTEVASLKTTVAQLDVRLTKVEEVVFNFQTNTTREFRELRNDTAHRFLGLETRVAALELSMTDVTHGISEIRSTTLALFDIGVSVAAQLRDHERRITSLEARP